MTSPGARRATLRPSGGPALRHPARPGLPTNRGKQSPWLAPTIRQQAGRHSAALEPPRSGSGLMSGDNHFTVPSADVHLSAGSKTDLLANFLRDNDLPLGANSMSHTG